jgi:hypothetical protein
MPLTAPEMTQNETGSLESLLGVITIWEDSEASEYRSLAFWRQLQWCHERAANDKDAPNVNSAVRQNPKSSLTATAIG